MVTSRPLNYWCINANTICQSNSKLLVSTRDRLFPLNKNDYLRFNLYIRSAQISQKAQTPQGRRMSTAQNFEKKNGGKMLVVMMFA